MSSVLPVHRRFVYQVDQDDCRPAGVLLYHRAALSLGDIKKLRSIGVKTIIWFLATGGISATIGLILANIIKPGRGLQLGTAETAMEVKELPGIYQTLLDLIPSNPFQH